MTVAPETDGVPEPGTVLLNKYRIERVLGQGGMGVVVSAWHNALEQRVALKFLVGDAIGQREAVERFLREARAAVKLHSEHVAKVTDVGTLDSGSPYMVMEFLDGRDLGDLIDDGQSLPLATSVDYVIQAIDAVAEAHARGIVHRDLKPSNLFVARRDDGGSIIKVLDFGISKADTFSDSIDKAALTRTATVMGSPLYMSPEQFRSSKKVDWRTDIWALGVILYELICHEVPFAGETVGEVFESVLQNEPMPVRELRPDAAAGLEDVILRCLRKKPEERFGDVAELAQALAPFGTGESERCVERARRLLAGKSLSRLMVDGPPSSRHAMVVGGSGKRAALLPAIRRTSGGWGTSSSHMTLGRSRWQVATGLVAAAVLFVGGVALVKVVDRTDGGRAAAAASGAVDPLAGDVRAGDVRAEDKPGVLAAGLPAAQAVAQAEGASLQMDAGSLASHAAHKAPPKAAVKASVPAPGASASTAKATDGVLDERH